MELSMIKSKTKEMFNECVERCFLQSLISFVIYSSLLIIGVFLSLYSNWFLLLVFLLAPLRHGITTVVYKAIRSQDNKITIKDALSGFDNYLKLLPTYLIKDVILLIGFIFCILICFSFNLLLLNYITNTINLNFVSYDDFIMLLDLINSLTISIFFIFYSIVSFLQTRYCFTHYVVEKLQFKGLKALKTASQLSKKYRWYIFKIHFMNFVGTSGSLFFTYKAIIYFNITSLFILIPLLIVVFLFCFMTMIVEVNVKVCILFDCITSIEMEEKVNHDE